MLTVGELAGLARERHDHHIDAWITLAQASGIPADGLINDYDPGRARLTLAWSSAAAEGNVTRIKELARQMYGRATLDHPRRHVRRRT